MKRVISALLSAAVTAAYIVPVSAVDWSDPAQETQGVEVKELVNYDFNEYETDLANGTLPANLGLVENAGYISSYDFGGDYGTVLEVGYTGATNSSDPLVQIACSSEARQLQFEFDFYDPTFNSRLEMSGRGVTSSDGIGIANYRAQSNGVVYTPDFSTGYFDGCTRGEWHHIRYALNLDTGNFSMWLDGEVFVDDRAFQGYGDLDSGLTQLRLFVIPYLNTYPGYLYIDNISAYEIYNYPEALEVSAIKDGTETEEIPYDAEAIKVTLSGSADPATVNSDTVILSQGGNSVACDVAYDESVEPSIIITPLSPLKSGTEYTVTVTSSVTDMNGSHSSEDQTLSFTTGRKEFNVLSYSFDAADGSVSFRPTIENRTDEEKDVVSIITVWSGNTFISARAAEATIGADSTLEVSTPSVELPNGAVAFGYVWDGLGTAVSVAEEEYSYPEGNSHSYSGGTVAVSGSTDAGAGVTAVILPSGASISDISTDSINNGEAVLLTLFADENGSYGSSVTLGGSFDEGEYTLYKFENGTPCEPETFEYVKRQPTVSITYPSAGTYTADELTEVSYSTENFSDGIETVELLCDGEVIDQSSNPNGSFAVSLESGYHELTVRAVSLTGETAEDSVNVSIAGSAITVIADADFNNYTSGSPEGVDTGSVASNGGYVRPVFVDEEHGQSLELGAEGVTSASPFFGIPTGDTNDIVQAEAEVYFPEDNPATLSLTIRNSATPDSVTLAHFRPYNSNEVYIPGSGGATYGGLNCFELGKWYKIRYVIDGSTNTFSLWLDDTILAEDRVGDNTNVTVLNQLRFLVSSSSETGARVIFDNVRAEIITNFPYITGFGSVVSGEELDYVDYSADTVFAELSAPVDSGSIEEEMTLSCGSGTLELADITLSEDLRKVYFSVPRLFSNTEYTLTLGSGLMTAGGTEIGYEQSESFVTSMKDVDIASAGFNVSGTEKSFVPTVKNDTGNSVNVVSVLNIWNGSDITDTAAAEASIDALSQAEAASPGLRIGSGDTAEGIVFTDGGVLVGDRFFGEGSASGGTASGYDPETGMISVTAETDYAFSPVGIMIIPFGSSEINAGLINEKRAVYTAVYADAEGKAGRSIGLSSLLDGGKYTVYTIVDGVRSEGYTFVHLNEEMAQAVIPAVNAASSASELRDIISENAAALGIDEEEFAKDPDYISRLIFDNKPEGGYTPATFYAEAYSAVTAWYIVNTDDGRDMLIKYASVIGIDSENDIESLSDEVWSYVYDYMKEQDYSEVTVADALLCGTVLGEISSVQRYTELEQIIIPRADQLVIDTDEYNDITYKDDVWKYFYNNRSRAVDLESLIELFDDAVNDADGSSAGGGGGASGGGSGGSGGGSGSGMLGTYVDNIDSIISQPQESVFSDISGHWAEDIIIEMSDAGIIAGFEDGTFKPDDKVTRAQFCKMIVTALGLSYTGGSGSYDDVPAGAWYEIYVETATEYGIVMGDNGSFNPDSYITRQDAAVMLYRGIRSVDRNVFGSKTFNDSGDIAEYAVDEISRLGGAGIINGMDDGTFRPLNNATRAESAAMIMNMVNYIGE